MINKILLLFFVFLSLIGLYFNVEMGVFVGLVFIPWQVLRINPGKKVHLFSIIITSLVGLIYFIYNLYNKGWLTSEGWLALGLFVFIEIYNYWQNTTIDNGNDEKEVD